MTIKEDTIIFTYNAEISSKIFYGLGWLLLFFLFVSEVIVGIWVYDTWQEILTSAFTIAGIVLPVVILLWVIAFVQKKRQLNGLFITISPEGITDSKGRLIPIADIDHCHLEYHDTIPYNQKTPRKYSGYPEYLVILLKSGKTKKLKIRMYDAPSDPESVYFHETANRILGIMLFTERTVVHEKETY